jgi:hypothetical protein
LKSQMKVVTWLFCPAHMAVILTWGYAYPVHIKLCAFYRVTDRKSG